LVEIDRLADIPCSRLPVFDDSSKDLIGCHVNLLYETTHSLPPFLTSSILGGGEVKQYNKATSALSK
jgi:hypothetical protein